MSRPCPCPSPSAYQLVTQRILHDVQSLVDRVESELGACREGPVLLLDVGHRELRVAETVAEQTTRVVQGRDTLLQL